MHLGLLALVLAATVTIASRPGERPRLTDVAIAPAPMPESPQIEPQAPSQTAFAGGSTFSPKAAPTPELTGRATGLARQAPPALAQPRSAVVSAASESQPQRAVSFAGVSAQAARRVVYVVDASGSMVSSYAFVRARLAQSIARLSPTQYFQVILVRGLPEGGSDVQMLPTGDRSDPLLRALPSTRESAIARLRDVVVSGRSDPIAGLERALTIEPRPDVVFFLARGFQRSGPNTEWGQGVDSTLASLDRLNPRSRRTGLRPVVIKTIQFLEDDPTGLMSAIADAHGDGPGSFRVLSLDDLADEGVQDQAIPRATRQEAQIRRAREALRSLGADDLHVLYGLALPEQRVRVQQAVNRVREVLAEGVDDHAAGSLAARAALLDAALRDDAAAAAQAAERLEAIFVVDAEADAARRLMLAHALALAGRVEQARSVADGLGADIGVLGLSEALAEELGLLRVRFDLGSALAPADDWAQLVAEASARRLLSEPATSARAFDALLAWASSDQRRDPIVWRLVASATDGLKLDGFPTPVLFARGMGLAPDRPREAIELLLQLADRTARADEASVVRDALWEAAVLARDRSDPRAPALLERFSTAYPRDARAIDALIVALDLTPDGQTERRVALLAHLIDAASDHSSADAWRLELASHLDTRASLRVLVDISPASAAARPAADLVWKLLESASDPGLLASGVALLERLDDGRSDALRRRLGRALLPGDPASALRALEPLASRDAEVSLLRAQALLGVGRRDEALSILEYQASALRPDRPEHWQAWTLLLEAIASDSAQADALQAHLFRLRLLDPDLGGDPWRRRLENLAAVPPDS